LNWGGRMFGNWNGVRVFLYMGKVDFRKAINGLSIIVESEMREKPLSGNLYVFCHRRRDRIKILYWNKNGFCLLYKRLEEHRFRWPKSEGGVMTITHEELSWLLAGLDIMKAHRQLTYAGVT
jgi:transposase